jgi:hypothetical protein
MSEKLPPARMNTKASSPVERLNADVRWLAEKQTLIEALRRFPSYLRRPDKFFHFDAAKLHLAGVQSSSGFLVRFIMVAGTVTFV